MKRADIGQAAFCRALLGRTEQVTKLRFMPDLVGVEESGFRARLIRQHRAHCSSWLERSRYERHWYDAGICQRMG
jgi:hypothetical protein